MNLSDTQSSHHLFRRVGRVKDAHGLKGELFVRLFAGRADRLDDFSSALLVSPDESEALAVQVEAAKLHKDGLIIKLHELEGRTPAEALKGYQLEIPADLLISKTGEDIFLDEIIGFKVVDEASRVSASVESVASNGAQDLLVVSVGGEERLIPLVREFIVKIDFELREIRMRLPAGLIDQGDLRERDHDL